jgi:hypothetical protein
LHIIESTRQNVHHQYIRVNSLRQSVDINQWDGFTKSNVIWYYPDYAIVLSYLTRESSILHWRKKILWRTHNVLLHFDTQSSKDYKSFHLLNTTYRIDYLLSVSVCLSLSLSLSLSLIHTRFYNITKNLSLKLNDEKQYRHFKPSCVMPCNWLEVYLI